MPCRCVLALVFAITFVAVSHCETYDVKISKVKGHQLTYQACRKVGDQRVYGESVTTQVAKGVIVTRGGPKRFNAKKGVPLKGGLADPDFTRWVERTVHGQIIIAEDGPNKGKIIAINLNVSSPPK